MKKQWLLFISIILITLPLAAETISYQAPDLPANSYWEKLADPGKDKQYFQFYIVSDRNGGMQPGVFEEAVEKLNFLQPELVMSVGDLIVGYTKDEKEIDAQWQQFDKLIEKLDAPFLPVNGNHDIMNSMMNDYWQKKFGRPYYHFIYNNILFLCASTEDPRDNISDEQIAYFADVLEKYPDVDWTFSFQHRPYWQYDANKPCFDKYEALFDNRDVTFFGGHTHQYRKETNKGHEYYTLATTGGKSDLLGPDVGKFHHLTTVTMTPNGPKLALIDLAGIYSPDINDETEQPYVEALCTGNWKNPQLLWTGEFDSIATEITITNPMDAALEISGVLFNEQGLLFEPRKIEATIGPNETRRIPLTIVNSKHLKKADILPIPLDLTATYDVAGRKPISVTAQKIIMLDSRNPINKATGIIIDGKTEDWAAIAPVKIDKPNFVQNPQTWNGPEDGSYSIATAYDEKNLYLLIQTTDDKLIITADKLKNHQDQLFIHMDARAEKERLTVAPQYDIISDIRTAPDLNNENGLLGGHPAEGSHVICRAEGKQIIAEISIPIAYLNEQQGGNWKSFRLNVGFMDEDIQTFIGRPVIWWWPTWIPKDELHGTGTFYKN